MEGRARCIRAVEAALCGVPQRALLWAKVGPAPWGENVVPGWSLVDPYFGLCAHCFVSSNSFHGQIIKKLSMVFEQERP